MTGILRRERFIAVGEDVLGVKIQLIELGGEWGVRITGGTSTGVMVDEAECDEELVLGVVGKLFRRGGSGVSEVIGVKRRTGS